MNILVCIKQVPASNQVEVDSETGVLKRDGTASKMNPYDLFALETALSLRERYGGEVAVLTMGPMQAAAIIKEAYSMGADMGILLSDRAFAGADVLATSYALSLGARACGKFDLILCGKQTTDGDTAQVGSEMAEQLQIPSIANVLSLDLKGEKLAVTMDMGDSILTAEVTPPCLISVDKDICQPRLPSYLKKKETSDREITILSCGDIENADKHRCGLSGSPTQVHRIFPPQKNDSREKWEGSGTELASRIFQKLAAEKLI